MKGQYKGVQSRLLKENELALFCPCACHSLNLAENEAAECCPETVTFFGILQKFYKFFSPSPQGREIFQVSIGALSISYLQLDSQHNLSVLNHLQRICLA